MDYRTEIAKTWNELAAAYHEKFKDLAFYDESYALFCDLIKTKNASLFEIACGPGNVTRSLLKLRSDLQIDAIDIAPSMLKLAKEINPRVDFKEMDCRKIDHIQKRFDAILCGFCMPYLTQEECEKLIYDCSVLLKENGIFYFSLIEGDYKKSKRETSSDGKHSMFVYLHEQNFIEESLQKNNFQLLHLLKIPYQKSNSEQDMDLIFISRKMQQ